MIPINLSISGFLSYRDPVEIDFTGFDLACIAGANGAGKSSILDAITWVLFGKARKTDDSLINTATSKENKGFAEVRFSFEYEGNIFKVQRIMPAPEVKVNPTTQKRTISKKPTMLEFSIYEGLSDEWKTLSERTMRGTQTRIEQALRLDYDTFINAAFFLQGKADQFTQQRPGDRKRILANILGLETWETYRQRAAKKRKDIETETRVLDGRLSEINAELSEEGTRKARLSELQTELERLSASRQAQEDNLENIKKIAATLEEQRKLVDTLSRQLDTVQKRMAELERRAQSRQEEKQAHAEIITRQDEIQEAYQRLGEARAELARWDEIGAQFLEQEKRRQVPLTAIEAERARLMQERDTLEEQFSALSSQLSALSDLQSQIADHQSSIQNLQSKIENRKSLESELQTANQQLANAKAENPRLKAEMDELKGRIDQLNATEGAACPLCGQPLAPQERQNLIAELETLGKSMGDKWRANRTLLAEADHSVANLQSQISVLQSLDDDLLLQRAELNKLAAQVEQIEAQNKSWQEGGQPRLESLVANLQSETFASEARTELALIDTELKEIGYDAAAHDQARRVAADPDAENDQRALERAQAAIEPLENELGSLHDQISNLQSEIGNQQSEHDDAAAALAAAQASAPDVRQAQMTLLDIQGQENQLRMEVGAAQQKVNVLAELKKRRKALEAQREKLAQGIGHYKELERAFGKDGVPALLIEQALPQIETKANQILERLSDGNMSVSFQTQRELKTRDTLKETLDIIISDSAGQRDYEMFSGGEAFRVNFAIRLALSEILAQRAGARLQTLVIDEGFGSQDALGRQRLIEAINTVKADFAKILVITHIEALKDFFPTRIEVEKTPRGSTVTIM